MDRYHRLNRAVQFNSRLPGDSRWKYGNRCDASTLDTCAHRLSGARQSVRTSMVHSAGQTQSATTSTSAVSSRFGPSIENRADAINPQMAAQAGPSHVACVALDAPTCSEGPIDSAGCDVGRGLSVNRLIIPSGDQVSCPVSRSHVSTLRMPSSMETRGDQPSRRCALSVS